VRGKGLMIGMVMAVPCSAVVTKCLERGLLINCTNDNILRFVPPLVIALDDVDKAIKMLDGVLGEL
jgi:acetylornithine/N-succinyldiaminopimelate aminotransferase